MHRETVRVPSVRATAREFFRLPVLSTFFIVGRVTLLTGKKYRISTQTVRANDKLAVNVNGVVVDGVGQGTAKSKRPAVSWTVTVR